MQVFSWSAALEDGFRRLQSYVTNLVQGVWPTLLECFFLQTLSLSVPDVEAVNLLRVGFLLVGFLFCF